MSEPLKDKHPLEIMGMLDNTMGALRDHDHPDTVVVLRESLGMIAVAVGGSMAEDLQAVTDRGDKDEMMTRLYNLLLAPLAAQMFPDQMPDLGD